MNLRVQIFLNLAIIKSIIVHKNEQNSFSKKVYKLEISD